MGAAHANEVRTLTDGFLPALDPAWRRPLAEIVESGARRIVVIGPTDVGKSSFIRALATLVPLALIDLDPGQKMIGASGTVGRGAFDAAGRATLERFRWIGSTSAASIAAIVRAAETLGRSGGFVANTAGYVAGPGARLQAATIAALAADLVVAIGLDAPPLPSGWSGRLLRLDRSTLARRKSPALRTRLRQQTFERHLGAEILRLSSQFVAFDPGLPRLPPDEIRPVCALADAAGEDMAIAILIAADEQEVVLQVAPPPRPIARIRLGRMWAAPAEGGWRLLERRNPAAFPIRAG